MVISCRLNDEVKMLFQFDHKNILRVYGFTFWKSYNFAYYGIISEEIKCGNLKDLLGLENEATNELIAISWKLRIKLFLLIADGLFYLHTHNPRKQYIHLDIKPENILITENMMPKIADFGSTQIIKATGTNHNSQIKYTFIYAAPEVLRNPDTNPAPSMDVYRQESINRF